MKRIIVKNSKKNWSWILSSTMFYVIGLCVIIFVWYLATKDPNGNLYRFNIRDTFWAFAEIIVSSRFWEGVFETLNRLFIGIGIAAGLGIPIGILVGYFIRVHQFTYITFQFLRMISPLSWTPVAIILFGLGSEPVYFLIAIAAIWPIIINTASGVKAADKQWVEVAKCLGAKDIQILRYVITRASLPSLLVGLQLAFGVAWIVIVPAEMLGVSSGLGYMILDYRDINEYSSIMAVILVIGVIGICLDLPLRYAIKKVSW